MPDDLAIHTTGLTKRFGHHVALSDLDLEVPRGVVFGYLGPNGAGKTTTIKLLAGLYRPTAGRAVVLGKDPHREPDVVQSRIGYLPGDFTGYGDHTGRRFLGLLGALRGGVDRAYVEALARRFGLDLDRRLGTLSHGNRQKVGIIQAVMHRPDLVILDEPTNGLDPLMQQEFLTLLEEIRSAGGTVLLSSHVLAEVAAVADLVGLLDAGRLIAVRSMHEVRADAVRTIALTFADPESVPVSRIRHVESVRSLLRTGSTLHLTVAGPLDELMRVAAPYGIDDIQTHESDLTDVFLSYYRKDGDQNAQHLRQGDVGPAAQPAGVG